MWYDPIKPHALVEYEWVLRNVSLTGQKIIDAGAHHGQYALLFALGSGNSAAVLAVDAVESNCAITEANLSLNAARATVWHGAVGVADGTVQFTGETNGRIVDRGAVSIRSRRLPSLMADATIVKLDVEGEEFRILPDQLTEMTAVHTWIVEVHPWKTRNPLDLIRLFSSSGFELKWINRASLAVELYPADADWSVHTTLIASKV